MSSVNPWKRKKGRKEKKEQGKEERVRNVGSRKTVYDSKIFLNLIAN